MGKVTEAQRAELDEAARWRPTIGGLIVCDPTLDEAIEALPDEVREAIGRGRNYTAAQVAALAAGKVETACDDELDGT